METCIVGQSYLLSIVIFHYATEIYLSQVRLSFLLGWILPYNTILRRTWHCLLMLWEAVKSIGAWAAEKRYPGYPG
jgi:hypothetical protein